MLNKEFIPLQEKVEMYLKHDFKHKFNLFANAFMKKYNTPSSWVYITICECKQIDKDKFAFIRRYENPFTSTPTYERIVYDRQNQLIDASMFDDNHKDKIAEQCVYKADGANTIYETFLYKNPGWKSYLRRQLHSWGIDKMNNLLLKEKELMKKKKESLLKLKSKIPKLKRKKSSSDE